MIDRSTAARRDASVTLNVIVPELVAVSVTFSFPMAEADPPKMLMSPLLESPAAVRLKCRPKRAVLLSTLTLVPVLVSFPPIVRLLPRRRR